MSKHAIIDGDASPFIPEGLSVVRHRRSGRGPWDGSRTLLYRSRYQKALARPDGYTLQRIVKKYRPYNANYLDFLLANPHMIPEDWKSAYVFFWGTVYRASNGALCVRYLRWGMGEWESRHHQFEFLWGPKFLAAVPA